MTEQMSLSAITPEYIQQQIQLLSTADFHADISTRFSEIFNSILEVPNDSTVETLKAFIDGLISENVSLVISRPILSDMINKLLVLPDAVAKEISHYILEKVEPRFISFEDHVVSIRRNLSAIYEKEKKWREAAEVLAGIDLETGRKQYSVNYKFKTYLSITQLYLEANDIEEAEAFINRASCLLQNIENPTTEGLPLRVQYTAYYAKILDLREKYMDAAFRYNELSSMPLLTEDERINALRNSFICTILAPLGKQKSYMLPLLYKDKRCSAFPGFSVLEKIYQEQIIQRDELKDFITLLAPHHKVPTDGGEYSTLEKSINEHNVVFVKKLYSTITMSGLARRLEVSQQNAEKIASHMIAEGKLNGRIDQVSEVLEFEQLPADEAFSRRTLSFCTHLSAIAELMSQDSITREWMNEHRYTTSN